MNSLRVRLILIVVCAILPMVALVGYNDLSYRQEAVQAKQKELQDLIRNCEIDYRHTIVQTKQLLAALANFPAVANQENHACSELFAKVIKENRFYHNIMAAKPDGEVFASAIPLPQSNVYRLTDRLYFQCLLETKEFCMGELVTGQVLKQPTLPCGYPALDNSGRIRSVVAAGLNLAHLSSIFQVEELPADASLTIIDHQGRLMYRRLDQGKLSGQDFSHVEITRIVLAQKRGMTTAVGIDGQEKFYAFMPLGETSLKAFIYAGFPTADIYAHANTMLLRNLALLAVITFLVLMLARVFGYVFIMRGMKILTNTARRLAKGDLTARTGLPHGKGEIGALACTFDVMAGNLQQRNRELRQAKKKWETTFNTVPDPVAVLDTEFRFITVNEAMAARMGLTRDEAVGRKCYEVIDKTTSPPAYCPYAKLLADGREHFQEVREENWGGDFIVSVSPLFDSQGEIIAGVRVARDISVRRQAEREKEKVIAELQEALAQVKTLKGFIPICANCKKIRDDEGFWNSVEKYISEHAEVKFSHGICPDCLKLLYPDYLQKNRNDDV